MNQEAVNQALATINALLRTRVVASLPEIEGGIKALNTIVEELRAAAAADDGQPDEAA